jgi:hypothetical protein
VTWYETDIFSAIIERLSCRQFTPGDSLSIRTPNWDVILDDDDDDDENWSDIRAPSGERSSPGDGSDNDHSKG